MKTNLLRCPHRLVRALAVWSAATAALGAAPLAETTAVHTKPDAAAPAITFLKAGTEPVAVTGAVADTPAGWMAIELPGPFEGYVESKDLMKSLDVKPGAPIRLAPKPDAPVLAVAEKGDKTSIAGIHGKWMQISLEKKLTGYINLGGTPGYLPPLATTPATAAPAPLNPPSTAAPLSPAPVAPSAYGVTTAGQPAPMVNLGDGGASSLPRQFAGKFVTTRRAFTPRRPYDWALNDDAGKRFAYLDVSKLLQTDQIEKYANHEIVVFGTARSTVDGKDLVIQVETLQLK
ncbi:MAG TPA: SH3 domain-containing protein [Opitutaceae bacterium]|nr:SH3 domain-containing protein [Opitutaceae bacterium]